jgi:hypothetical protein
VLLQHLEAQQTVVDQDDVAHADVVDEILIIDVDRADFLGIFARRTGADGEIENLAGLQLDGRRDVAGANQEFVGLRIKVRKELGISSRGNPPRPTNSLNRREAAENRRRNPVFAARSAA